MLGKDHLRLMYLKAEWSYQFTCTMTEYKVLPNRVRETERPFSPSSVKSKTVFAPVPHHILAPQLPIV